MYSQNSNSEAVVNFIKRRKINLRKVFHSKCCLCGFDTYQDALEFHHVNPKEKMFSICDGSNQTKALSAQLEEMKKCILVCANCHRGIHQNLCPIPDNWRDFYDYDIANQLLEDLEKVRTHQITYCQRCGKEISNNKATYCPDCAHLMSRTCDRPNRDELKEMIRTLPFTRIAEKYNVTDNAIRKWCKAENLPSRKSDINKYTDEQWIEI